MVQFQKIASRKPYFSNFSERRTCIVITQKEKENLYTNHEINDERGMMILQLAPKSVIERPWNRNQIRGLICSIINREFKTC